MTNKSRARDNILLLQMYAIYYVDFLKLSTMSGSREMYGFYGNRVQKFRNI